MTSSLLASARVVAVICWTGRVALAAEALADGAALASQGRAARGKNRGSHIASMGLPVVIIRSSWIFHVVNHPVIGVPPWLWKPL